MTDDVERGRRIFESGKHAVTPERDDGEAAQNRHELTDSTESTGLAGSDVEGALNRIRAWLQRFICPMDRRDLDLLALWIVHTYLVDETYTTPRLLIESPVPESGKTTVLEHAERLCQHPLQMATVSSPAMLTRALEKGMRTILIDEADRSLNPDKPGIDDLIGSAELRLQEGRYPTGSRASQGRRLGHSGDANVRPGGDGR